MTFLQQFDGPLGGFSYGLHLVDTSGLQGHQNRHSVRNDLVLDCRGEGINGVDADFLNIPVRAAYLFDQDWDKPIDKGSKLLLQVEDHSDQTLEEGCMRPQAVALKDLDDLFHDVVKVVPEKLIARILDHLRETLGSSCLCVLVRRLCQKLVWHLKDLLEQIMLRLRIFSFLHRVEDDHSEGVGDDGVQVWLAVFRLLEQDADQFGEVSDERFLENLCRLPVDLDVLLFLLWFHMPVLPLQLAEEAHHVFVLPDLAHHELADLFAANRHGVNFAEFGEDSE